MNYKTKIINRPMRINLVSVENDLMSIGFRKMSSWIKSIHTSTRTYYIPLIRKSFWAQITTKQRKKNHVPFILDIAEEIAKADIICFSSMSDYASYVHALIKEIRVINPKIYIIWGGIHPIIVPDDAIKSADAICTGEGEFAFQEFLDKFLNDKDYTDTRNFWFRVNGNIVHNPFRPLMTNEEMDSLPLLEYASGDEMIYESGRGFRPMKTHHYLKFIAIAYNTVWSIGCPFKCTYCGNSKFIDNDKFYQRLRHPSVDYIIREIKQAVNRHPYIGSVVYPR